MENNPKDNLFFINWRDAEKNIHRIGILAHIDKTFYIRTSIPEIARQKGCIGFGSFIDNTGYTSDRLFDTIKTRIFNKYVDSPLEELKEKPYGGSMVDSFSFEEIKEPKRKKYIKKLLLDLFQAEEKARRLKEKKLDVGVGK